MIKKYWKIITGGLVAGLLGGLLFFGSDFSLETSISKASARGRVIVTPDQNQPVGALLPKGALSVPVIRFFLESKKDTVLSSLTIHRKGAGKTEYLSWARLLIDGKVISEKHFSVSDHAVQFGDLDFKLKRRKSLAVELQVDFLPQTESSLEYQFQTEAGDLVFQNALPLLKREKISGNIFRIGNLSADRFLITNPGVALFVPKARSKDEMIGKFIITTGDHDLLLKRIVLRQEEALTYSELHNIRLRLEGDTIAISMFQNNAIEFLPSEMLLKKKKSKTFTVLADIKNPSKTEKIRLSLEKPEDITALDIEFGFGAIANNQFDSQIAWCVGAASPICPSEGFRKTCTRLEKERNPGDC